MGVLADYSPISLLCRGPSGFKGLVDGGRIWRCILRLAGRPGARRPVETRGDNSRQVLAQCATKKDAHRRADRDRQTGKDRQRQTETDRQTDKLTVGQKTQSQAQADGGGREWEGRSGGGMWEGRVPVGMATCLFVPRPPFPRPHPLSPSRPPPYRQLPPSANFRRLPFPSPCLCPSPFPFPPPFPDPPPGLCSKRPGLHAIAVGYVYAPHSISGRLLFQAKFWSAPCSFLRRENRWQFFRRMAPYAFAILATVFVTRLAVTRLPVTG